MIRIKNTSYYTPQEVATKFGVTMSTIARWRQSGKIKGFSLNKRKFLYSEEEIEKFIKGV